MTEKNKKKYLKLLIEFIKLQLTGNILFWGTYSGYFVFNGLLHWDDLPALATASLAAHAVYFVVNKEWVFDDKTGKRRAGTELFRFILFMILNFFINIGIITGLEHYFGITPYIGQFIAGLFFTAWSFIGMRFWVFQEVEHHSLRTKYVKERKKRRAKRTGGRRKAK